MTYGSLRNVAQRLIHVFWSDITTHHPTLTDFKVGKEAATAWKARMAEQGRGGGPRADYYAVLFCVRAFYLDLAQ